MSSLRKTSKKIAKEILKTAKNTTRHVTHATSYVSRALTPSLIHNRSNRLLTERLQRLSSVGYAEYGEYGFIPGHENRLMNDGFEKLMENKNCEGLQLPNFSPDSNSNPFRYGWGVYKFKNTWLKNAILSNIGYKPNTRQLRRKQSLPVFVFLSCNLSGASLDNAGNSIFEEGRTRKDCCYFDFNHCNLKGTNLSDMIGVITVHECDARRSNFSNADVAGWKGVESNFSKSNFEDANFTNMKLTDCVFDNCNLDGADFSNTECGNCKFQTCSFKGAKFTGADIRKATFDNCDLLGVALDITIGIEETRNFPFTLVNRTKLLPAEKYYMMLDSDWPWTKGQVAKLEGIFVRNVSKNHSKYAVFKQVSIVNKKYRPGQCQIMYVRHPEDGHLMVDECDSYSDKTKNRVINQDREVYFDDGQWKFGLSTRTAIATKKVLDKLPTDMGFEINTFLGTETPFPKTKTKAKGGMKKTPL
jgi:uncharacterized protein YjbI with pentapeptide repeats